MDTQNTPKIPEQISFGVADCLRQAKAHPWVLVVSLMVLAVLEFYALHQPYPQAYIGKDKIFLGKANVLVVPENQTKYGFQEFWDSWIYDEKFMGEVLARTAAVASSPIPFSPASTATILRQFIQPNLKYQIGPGYIVVSLQLPASEKALIRPFLREFSSGFIEKLQAFGEKLPDHPAGSALDTALQPKLLTEPNSSPVPVYPPPDLRRIYAFIPLSVVLMAMVAYLFLEFLEKRPSRHTLSS